MGKKLGKELKFEDKLSQLLIGQKRTNQEMTNIEIVKWLKECNFEVISSHHNFVIYKFGEDDETNKPNFYMLYKFKNKTEWETRPHKLDVIDGNNFYKLKLNGFIGLDNEEYKETIINLYKKPYKVKVLWNIEGYIALLCALGYSPKR